VLAYIIFGGQKHKAVTLLVFVFRCFVITGVILLALFMLTQHAVNFARCGVQIKIP